jgi:hypothetical protein
MGQVRTIQLTESLDAIWEQLVYTEGRFLGDALTRDLAAAHADLLKTLETVRAGQHAAWRTEVVAQASANTHNGLLNAATSFGSKLLAAVTGKRDHARRRRYFPDAVSDVVKLALGRHIERVRGWPSSLRGEPEPSSFADCFEQHLEGGGALRSRVDAASARSDQRVGEIVALVEDVNAARLSALGRLLQRAVKNDLSREWVESFFRRSQRRASAPNGDTSGDGGGVSPAP